MARPEEEPVRVGLCRSCRHARVIRTPRSTFWLCELSATDPRFDKYPRLPVLECVGYEPDAEERRDAGAGDKLNRRPD